MYYYSRNKEIDGFESLLKQDGRRDHHVHVRIEMAYNALYFLRRSTAVIRSWPKNKAPQTKAFENIIRKCGLLSCYRESGTDLGSDGIWQSVVFWQITTTITKENTSNNTKPHLCIHRRVLIRIKYAAAKVFEKIFNTSNTVASPRAPIHLIVYYQLLADKNGLQPPEQRVYHKGCLNIQFLEKGI